MAKHSKDAFGSAAEWGNYLLPEHTHAATPGLISNVDDPERARIQIEQTRERMSKILDQIENALLRKQESIEECPDASGSGGGVQEQLTRLVHWGDRTIPDSTFDQTFESPPSSIHAGSDPTRTGLEASLLRRVENTVRASLRRMTVADLLRAVEAPTPAATMAQIINAAPDVGLESESAWTRALARGAARKQEMIQRAGGVLSSSGVAKLLDISVSAVNQRKNKHRSILAVPLSGGEWGFPVRQFADGEVRSGVAEVMKAAGDLNPWVLLSILLDPVEEEGGPMLLDRLDDKAVRLDVLNRVRTYGEHVAG